MPSGCYDMVGDQVIDVIRPHCTWISLVADLQRGGSHRKDVGSAVLGKAITIDSDVNFHVSCKQCDIDVFGRIYIDKFVESGLQPRLELVLTVGRKGKSKKFE